MKLVLFDVDGTLIDAHRSGRRALARAFARTFGLDATDVDASLDRVSFAGCTDLKIVGDAADVLRLELDGKRDALLEAYLGELERGVAERPARRLPGVPAILKALQARTDRTIGLLTGNIREGARLKLGSCGLDTFFEDGGFGDDGLERADIARVAHARFTERIGHELPPRDVAVVGDTQHDVTAARACGFVSVAVDTGFGDPDALRASGPDVHLGDLSDGSWFLETWA
jgi:phosphoglycolate phosphatase-like HAD superfamily hydrolase